MYKPALSEFLRLTHKGNVIPVYKEINADLDTPVSAYLKACKGDYSFLFESVEGMKKIARYSFLGSNPCMIFKSKGRHITITYPAKNEVPRPNLEKRNTEPPFIPVLEGGDLKRRTYKVISFNAAGTPLDEIKKIMGGLRSVNVTCMPRFYGGMVGYIGYDTVRFFEKIPDANPDQLKIPDIVMMLTDTILVFDHLNHKVKIVANCLLPQGVAVSRRQKAGIYRQALNKLASIEKDFCGRIPQAKAKTGSAAPAKIASNLKKKEFCRIVTTAKKYIKKGDIIQVVLSQRFKIRIAKEPFEIYRRLRGLNPSPYLFFLKLKDIFLIGSSPEMLVRCEDGLVQTRPIAGTRPRGKNRQEDMQMEKELLADAKEKAEHLMLVDLGRNDIGRISQAGKVEVSEFMKVERYSHVMHLVSEVRGTLDKKRFDIYDVLKAAFPAGTVSGSPKIRAMEIIDELEKTRRGHYAGCVGYFSFSHNMDTCITIRTILIKGADAYVQAGGGIVADSVPEKEYCESVNKARALIEAIRG